MRNLKKMLTLGVSAVMMSSMIIGVCATGSQSINYKPSLDTNSNIGYVDGYASATIDVNGRMQYGAQPMNSDGSTVPTGDESVNRTHQLILTAPTALQFSTVEKMEAVEVEKDDGSKVKVNKRTGFANLTTSEGTLLNYSAYYEGKTGTDAEGKGYPSVPKEVEIKIASIKANGGDFSLGADTKGKMGAIDELYLQLTNASSADIGIDPGKDNAAQKFVEYTADNTAEALVLGTMKAGKLTNISGGATSVTPSKAVLKFTGKYDAEKGTDEKTVITTYRDGEDAANDISANFTLGLLFKYVYEPWNSATGEGYLEDSSTLLTE